jgi:MFS family permease
LKALSDGGWYGAAYFLSSTVILLSWGKVFQLFNVKGVFALTLAIFMTGSLITALAPHSAIFILGRSVSGLGAGGVFPGVITIVAHCVPLHRRASYTGALTSLAGVTLPFR